MIFYEETNKNLALEILLLTKELALGAQNAIKCANASFF